MKTLYSTCYITVFLLLTACAKQNVDCPDPQVEADPLLYKNPTVPLPERVDDLVSRMTLSEKIGQMYNDAPAIERLGVPAYDWWNEALHGVARAGKATVFPQAIGLAATFDKALLFDVASVISDEARAKHHYFAENGQRVRYTGLTFWSPNVNIFRDPRWGRGQETYGEDPYLTAELAVPFIQGMQGDDPSYLKTAAMAKHYAVHSGPEKTRHSDNYFSTPKDLRETYLPAFEAAVKKANVESIMCAYNRVNDLPACGSDPLLKDILRNEWGFQGHVVSDCGALADFYGPNDHALVMAPAAAAAWALSSGTDLNCGTGRLSTFANLAFALQFGMVSEDQIDAAVKRLFTTRFKLGMFDPAERVPYSAIPFSSVGSEQHLELALHAAERSLVLLKNDGVLPLKKDTKVAVIGPNAINPAVLIGNYHGNPIKPILPLDGIKQYVGEANVHFAPGSAIIADQYGHYRVIGAEYLFHEDEQGQLVPGLQADYYAADLEAGRIEHSYRIDQAAARVGEPVLTRIDPVIDFYWQKSPVDNQVRSEFGVVWKGVLVPPRSGDYLFKSDAEIQINGEVVEGLYTLAADEQYSLEVSRTFLRTKWGNPLEPEVKLSWVNTSENFVANAVAAAQKADVILFTGGISAELEGEEMDIALDGFDHGDRTNLMLPKTQRELLEVLHALNKPIVLINFSGSAMALNWEQRNLNAIVQAFYPGEATGTALARLLWGEINPSGKLPITFYKSVDDLPGFKDYSFNNRTYRYYKGDVLYPFGHGLSYSQFRYGEIVKPESITSGSSLTLSVDITNTSSINAAEVSQLYISMPDAPVSTPTRSLRGFERIEIKAGDSQTVTFEIPAEQLRYVDNEGNYQRYTGQLNVSIGSGQPGFVPPPQVQETSVTIL